MALFRSSRRRGCLLNPERSAKKREWDGSRETAERPKSAARSYRAVFSPKAGQVLRTLWRDPARAWKVTDLAKAAEVSLGHVSNSALRVRERRTVDDDGLRLTAPDALLRRQKRKDVKAALRRWRKCVGRCSTSQCARGFPGIAEKFAKEDMIGPVWARQFVEGTTAIGDRTPDQWSWALLVRSKPGSKHLV